jgi:ribosomal protein S1
VAGDGMMWQEVLKKKGILSTLAMQRHKALGKKRKKNEEKELIENQWFNTVKEAGAISTATPGFIPRPRYKKKDEEELV